MMGCSTRRCVGVGCDVVIRVRWRTAAGALRGGGGDDEAEQGGSGQGVGGGAVRGCGGGGGLLHDGWSGSMRAVAYRLPHDQACRVSHEAIYQWIYATPVSTWLGS